MFTSKFDHAAEIEAFRAGFKTSPPLSSFRMPTLIAVPASNARYVSATTEAAIRAEMERRCETRLRVRV